ncbi:hypothetical protein BN7_3514 [Wickerhamomyces ciferrii]|uniref:Uncharacterized protein n=1 Tax=Wickerhamomyces ciferrii (strain ATCC 14091 / BCRC 22168 / CBS 111 / JCM 3599 / NBRC 0793 / NRRL Y-1031 F-60-10) TaxID=1206466 RepID=K0KRM3_WICCF|nr:uncharacterized protein BN7_3514 [Wickerhamomyces ciferrii]CCH43959.1 hypothetical protein BN7_3514 [Wickerhamomyces ciferrii]
MFYSRRKKFSVYKDYFANDVLLSDVTFNQQESTPKQRGSKVKTAGRDGDEEIEDIFTLGDITNVADHVVTTRNQSPLKKVDEKDKKKIEDPPYKVVKPQRSKSRSRSGSRSTSRGKKDKKLSTKSRKKKEKKKLEPRPTVFDTMPKAKAKSVLDTNVELEVTKDGLNDTLMEEFEDDAHAFEIGPKSNSSLEIEDVPFILTKSSIPSLQLSEFYQPPQSTSTPFNNTFQGFGTLKPLTPRTSTPLPVRPLGYSTPLFHFSPDDIDLDENSLSDLSIYGGSISRIIGNDSPLSNKNTGDDGLFGNINSLSYKLKNSISLKESDKVYNDVDMSDPPRDDMDEDESINDFNISEDKHMDSSHNSSNVTEAGTISTLPNKSILKPPNSSSDKPKKNVRIDESTLYTSLHDDSKPQVTRFKRKAENDVGNSKSNKKEKNHNKAQFKYDELLALCGKGKDPLDLISK